MDNFKGGKFIVGTDIKADETKRIANELFRNQNENLRLSNETARTNAEIETKNSLFSQMGIITLIFVIIIILTVLSLLAYEKATNNQSLVDLDNIRRLNLTDLTVYEKSNLNTLTLTGDTTSSGGATYTNGVSVDGGLSVGTKSNFYGDIRAYGGVSVQGGLSVDGATNFYGGLDITGGVSMDGGLSVGTTSNLYGEVHAYKGVSMDGGLSVGTTSNLYGEVIAHSGVSVIGGLSINGVANFYEEVHTYKGVSIDAGLSVGTTSNLYGEVHAYQGVSIDAGLSVGITSNLYGEVHAYEGVSVDGGLSVGGVANFYNDLKVLTTAASTLALRPSIEINSFSDANDLATSASVLKLQKSATDTLDSFSATAANEVQGRIEGYGVNTASGSCLSSYIEFSGDAAPDTDSVPGKITFATSDADDAGAPTVRMTLDDSGKLGIGVLADDYIDEKDNLVVGSTSGNTGMTIVSGATAIGTIQFRSNTTVNDIEGWIDYSQNSKNMRFGTDGLNTKMTISSSLTTVHQPFLINSIETDVADAAAISLLTHASLFVTGGAETSTLAAGTEGQIKVLAMHTEGGNMVVTVTNAGWKSSGNGTITFDTIGDSCTLQYLNSKWFAVGNNACAFA